MTWRAEGHASVTKDGEVAIATIRILGAFLTMDKCQYKEQRRRDVNATTCSCDSRLEGPALSRATLITCEIALKSRVAWHPYINPSFLNFLLGLPGLTTPDGSPSAPPVQRWSSCPWTYLHVSKFCLSPQVTLNI